MASILSYFTGSTNKWLCTAYLYRALLCLFIGTGLNQGAHAQGEPSALINTASDTTAILKLVNKGKEYSNKMPNLALRYYTSALEKSKQMQYPKGIALASAQLGRWYFGNDAGRSVQLGREALESFENNEWGTTDNIADMHLLLAEAYDERGKKDSSAYYYYLLGEEMEAGAISNPEFAIQVFTKLSIFWINLDYGTLINKEYTKTVSRFVEKAKEASRQIKDSADAKSSVYFIQGAYYHALKNYDSARFYYNIYLVERERLNKLSTPRKISTHFNIADTYLQENNPDSALSHINIIKEIGKLPQNTKSVAFYTTFIDLLTAKAFFQKKQFQATIDILNKTLDDLKLTGNPFRNEVVESYAIYADAYEALGNYEKALEYKNTYVKLYDSLTKEEKIDMISRLEIKNRMAEKDKELALQKLTLSEVKGKVRDKNFWIYGISLLAISGGVIFALWRKKNIDKQNLQQERIDNLQQKIKIERLKASITGEERERTRIGRELHDGIGGLLSVARMNFELAKKTNTNETNEDFTDGLKLLEEATVELRKAAYNLMPEVLLNQGLASAVQAYCEKMMSKASTTIAFQAIGKRPFVTSAFDLPIYRIIQELVHNIIKHANATQALVQLNFQEDGTIDITIEDNGSGLPREALEKSTGMGLKNMKERVSDLGGKLDIQSSPETGTSIYLEFESFQENINTI